MSVPPVQWLAPGVTWVDTSRSWTGFTLGDPGAIWAELLAINADLGMVGVPAVPNPDDMLALLAEAGAGALVGVPTVARPTIQRGVIELDVPVHIAAKPPAGVASMQLLWALLPRCIDVLRPWVPAEPEPLTVGTVTVPAYLIRTRRYIEEL